MLIYDVFLSNSTRDFDQPFSYLPPRDAEEAEKIEVGSVVSVPFGQGKQERDGWVWRARELEQEPDFVIKHISKVKSPSLLRSDQFVLAAEIRRRYFTSMSQAIKLMAPHYLLSTGAKTQRYARLIDPIEALLSLEEGAFRSLGQMRVVEFLLDVEEASLQEIMSACQVSRAVIDGLRKKALLENFNKEVKRELCETPLLEEHVEHKLNTEQATALSAILSAGNNESEEFLLFGVTGSGKTEVYLRAAEAVIKSGRDVIILVPEISLTPLICNRIQARFGKSAAILHSRLSPSERYEQWRSIRSGEKRLVAGARSAIFAPLKDIGLIVIDEEQEHTYKSERSPRYEAADIARIRAQQHKAKLILASATPSVQTYTRSVEGKSKLLKLTQRAGGAEIPQSEIVDMRLERGHKYSQFFSKKLRESLSQSFAQGEQAMILLNRRGHSSFLICPDCGHIFKCENCDISLTNHLNPYNREKNLLICHYCGEISEPPLVCPECGSDKISPYGIGTQQAEELLQELYPQQKFLRMDFDSTSSRHAHAKILESFAKHEADCLLGTQMIAKGHDFAKVTTVGIISADMLLGQADYQAEERAFQLICQSAGRAGRRELKGRVIIQSFNPRNHAIVAGARQDYQNFYETEIFKRKTLFYPPFCDLGMLLLSSLSKRLAEEAAKQYQVELEYLLKKNKLQEKIRAYNYQAAPIARLRKHWRYRIILKSSERGLLTQVLTYLNDLKRPEGLSVTCDINPINMY